jgi:endonuclease/exonuclease/phosphatase family metal-dependent hydrolase
LDYLREFADFPYSVFGINNRRAGLLNLSYGNALLSRYPIAVSENIVFGRSRIGEKGFLFAEIEAGGLRVPLVNLHFHYRSRVHRLVQLDRLLAYLRVKQRLRSTHWAVSPIVCGDFNTPGTSSDATSSLLSHLCDFGDYVLHPQTGRSFPSPLPTRLLDFVFLPPGCRMIHSEVVKSMLSDHRPVLVDFEVG